MPLAAPAAPAIAEAAAAAAAAAARACLGNPSCRAGAVAVVCAITGMCNESAEDEGESEENGQCSTDSDGRHSPGRQSLNDLLNDLTNNGRTPLSPDDGDAAIDLADELGIPGVRDDRDTDHWRGGPHIHIPQSGVGDGSHIPAEPH